MSGIVVTGMHRSGTSLTAQVFTAGGWHPGESLLTHGIDNYEEDSSFVQLHREWIDTHLPQGEGHRDWGVSTKGQIDISSLPPAVMVDMHDEARSFVARRDRERPRWLAKDPRATLFLPIWGGIEALRFVLVYRNPWDMSDSAIRLGSDVFCRRPRFALQGWLDYNTRLLDFATAYRDRCYVVASEAIALDSIGVWSELRRAFTLDGDLPADLLDTRRYVRRDDSHPIARLYRDVHPEHCDVLARLDAIANIPRFVQSTKKKSPSLGHLPAPEGHDTSTSRVVPGGSLAAGSGVQVIIPCRDHGEFILEALASVEEHAQRVESRSGRDRVEVTIIDDGSTDVETLRTLDALRRSGYQVITTPGVGISGARNLGLAMSSTAAIIPLDSDNRLRSPLFDALELIEDGSCDVVHGPWQRFGMEHVRVEPPNMTLDSLVPGNTIDACALISRRLVDRLGGWDEELPFWEDWNMWLGAVGVGARIRRLESVTFDYLIRPGSLSLVYSINPDAHQKVVSRITANHADLLGPIVSRLIITIHQLIASPTTQQETPD